MRKILPLNSLRLLPGMAVLAVPVSALSADFSRCEPKQAEPDCIPGSRNATFLVNNDTINISPATGTGSVVAFNWPVKNCLEPSGQLRGQVMVVVDNSKSESITDRDNRRSAVVRRFIDDFATKAASSGPNDSNDAAYPKISVMNYNGRSGTEDQSVALDALNYKFTPDYCNQTNDQFPSASASLRWGSPSDASKLSICEFLSFTSAVPSSTNITNMKNFVDFAAAMPRGSTDFSYFFKGTVKAYENLQNSANVGRNLVVVTDGLPNIPKYIAADVCRSNPRLSREAIVTGERLGRVQDYCVDRQAPTAIAEAHAEARKFDKLNVHHVLFTQDQTAYFDYDDSGKASLNPAGFLIENSARTGNGKVKFSYARGQDQLSEKMNGLFTQFDKNALQYVDVEVTRPDASTFKYKAVSPSAPGSTFSIKFIGLKSGLNTVKITPVYQDGRSTSSSTINVNVGNGALDADLKCTAVPENKTVDGDLKGSTDPKGDGFYAEPTSTGEYRDYRNADDGNRLAQEFGLIGDSDGLEKITNLRLQGGTGNCGSIAAWGRLNSTRNVFGLLALLALPVLLVGMLGRRFSDRSERR